MVPAMWLLTPLHFHCGQWRERRERCRCQGLSESDSPRPLEAVVPSADELRKAGPEDPGIPQPSKAVRIPCVLNADVLGTVWRAQPCSSRTGKEEQPENWPISFEECRR